MKFKAPHLEMEFEDGLIPEVREALCELDEWSLAHGYPEVIVTHVVRAPAEQERIYWKRYANGLVDGVSHAEEEARFRARRRFSWHLLMMGVCCAVDIRNRHYTREQRKLVMQHLMAGRENGPWEILAHDVGRGDHIHVGRRRFDLRRAWEQAQEK